MLHPLRGVFSLGSAAASRVSGRTVHTWTRTTAGKARGSGNSTRTGAVLAGSVGLLGAGALWSLTRKTVTSASNATVRYMSSGNGASSGGVLAWYSKCLAENPLLTKIGTSVVIGSAGDVACQLFVDKVDKFDWRRLFNMAFLSGALVGPTLHVWYGFLATKVPGTTWVSVAKRLALDQLVFAPTFVGIFFVAMATVQGVPQQAKQRLSDGWVDAVITNYKLWPAAQVINFGFVPVQHQVLFANFVALIWNTYLSWATNKHTEKSSSN